MQNYKINIAIIGCGYWGPNLLRNFYQLPGVEISFVCDLDEKKLGNIRKNYPKIKTTTDYQEVLRDQNTQAICLATPLAAHFEMAKAGLLAGKDVLIEKPITENSQQAEGLIKISRGRNLILMVDHTFIYSGAIQKIKELIVKGELGKLYYFDSERINLGLFRSDTNVISDLAVHDLAIVDYLFAKKPISVSALCWDHIIDGKGETASINIKHEDNFISSIRVSWLSPVKIRKSIIAGSKKMILYDDVAPDEKIRVYDKGIDIDPMAVTPFQPAYRSGDIIIPKIDQAEPLKKMADHFTLCVRERKTPLTGGEAGLRVIKLIEAIEKSIKEGGKEIAI